MNAKCIASKTPSYEGDGQRSEVGVTMVNNLLLPLFYLLAMCSRVSTNVCVEILVYEKMLASSIFVDCRVPHFKRSATYRYFVFVFGVIAIWYFSVSTAAITVVAHSTSVEVQYASRIVFNNALALAGGVYFIYSIFCEGPVLGRLSSYRNRSPDTLKALSSMKVIPMPQLMLAVKAMVCAAQIARRPCNSCSLDQTSDILLHSAPQARLPLL